MANRSLIVNASPLILLNRAGHLSLLASLATRVRTPQAVVEELRAGAHIDATAAAVEAADWIEIVNDLSIPPAIQAWDLDPGESQVLAHALANPGSEAVLDDRAGRRCAAANGIPLLGTLGVVLAGKRLGFLTQASPVIESLRGNGLFLTDALVQAALAEVGE